MPSIEPLSPPPDLRSTPTGRENFRAVHEFQEVFKNEPFTTLLQGAPVSDLAAKQGTLDRIFPIPADVGKFKPGSNTTTQRLLGRYFKGGGVNLDDFTAGVMDQFGLTPLLPSRDMIALYDARILELGELPSDEQAEILNTTLHELRHSGIGLLQESDHEEFMAATVTMEVLGLNEEDVVRLLGATTGTEDVPQVRQYLAKRGLDMEQMLKSPKILKLLKRVQDAAAELAARRK
tara:strand:- start:383 stop:1084 length:702 start_codon:yes stop_codon:yes gene_type:complete